MDKHPCEGKRRQWRGRTFGIYKCTRRATGVIETNVGLSERHYCCGDNECYSSIARGYPAEFKALK